MKSFYKDIIDAEYGGKPAALCIVTSTKGSSPRKSGSKMIVFDDGSIKGTVGGGAIEKEVITEALQLIKLNKSKIIDYTLKDDLGMSCGGGMQVYIEPLQLFKNLYIFGAGHIGNALAGFAHQLNFNVTVIDERPGIFDVFTLENINKQNINFTEAIKNLPLDKSVFVVIVTHQHANDEQILKLICKKDLGYLGMIGSRAKVKDIKQRFIKEGILTEEEFANIDTPIGIPIASETPAEIAISILAKLIDKRNSI